MATITRMLLVVGAYLLLTGAAAAANELAEADRLFALGVLENYQKSIPLYTQAA